jgi:hypothetical protein
VFDGNGVDIFEEVGLGDDEFWFRDLEEAV